MIPNDIYSDHLVLFFGVRTGTKSFEKKVSPPGKDGRTQLWFPPVGGGSFKIWIDL